MDWHDQELLDKQLRGIIPPRHDGVIALMITAMFFAGLTAGMEFARKSAPTQIASDSAVMALAIPDNASQIVRR